MRCKTEGETDMERDQATQHADAVQDMTVYAEARAVFGEAGAQARLRTFREELESHLLDIRQGLTDPVALRDMAHKTAGRAGLFGFAALVEASASLDEAARHDSGVAIALDHWIAQVRFAVGGTGGST